MNSNNHQRRSFKSRPEYCPVGVNQSFHSMGKFAYRYPHVDIHSRVRLHMKRGGISRAQSNNGRLSALACAKLNKVKTIMVRGSLSKSNSVLLFKHCQVQESKFQSEIVPLHILTFPQSFSQTNKKKKRKEKLKICSVK